MKSEKERAALSGTRAKIDDLTRKLLEMGNQGETIATICIRLGPQHPTVRQRDLLVKTFQNTSRRFYGQRA